MIATVAMRLSARRKALALRSPHCLREQSSRLTPTRNFRMSLSEAPVRAVCARSAGECGGAGACRGTRSAYVGVLTLALLVGLSVLVCVLVGGLGVFVRLARAQARAAGAGSWRGYVSSGWVGSCNWSPIGVASAGVEVWRRCREVGRPGIDSECSRARSRAPLRPLVCFAGGHVTLTGRLPCRISRVEFIEAFCGARPRWCGIWAGWGFGSSGPRPRRCAGCRSCVCSRRRIASLNRNYCHAPRGAGVGSA